MLKNVFKSVLFLAAMCLFFVACQKESEVVTPKKEKPVLVEEKPMMFYKSLQQGNKLKGFYGDETTIPSKSTPVTIGGTSVPYNFILVPKIDGTFIWVMLSNLKSKPAGYSYYYYNDDIKMQKTGFLYKWPTANTLAGMASAKFPVLDANGNPITTQLQTITGARLPNFDDIYALFEYNTAGNLPQSTTPTSSIVPQNGYKGYLDAFIFGTKFKVTQSYGNATLGGLRAPWEYLATHGGTDGFVKYSGIIIEKDTPPQYCEGKIWLNEMASGPGYYYPLSITKSSTANGVTYPWSAFVNCGFNGEHGMSVRLVFDAVMQ
jgi:hypothetical protein